MKNFALLACTFLLASSAVLAGPPAKSEPKMTCAVMTKDPVDIKKATAAKMFADYKGNRYFFCCDGCPAAFKANPAKYAKNAHIKTPTAPAKKGA